MTPISNIDDKLPLRLHINQQFAAHRTGSFGDIIIMLQERASRELAHKILALDKFFEVTFKDGYGTQRADCIVMTEQEYADLMREQFKKGVLHAQGFVTREF